MTVAAATAGRPTSVRGPYPMGLMGLVATVVMLFAAFTAALLVRRTGEDWQHIQLPGILAWSTATVVLSSIVLELARAAVRRGAGQGALARLLWATWVLGALFLVFQVAAWRVLAAQGVFLPTSPHAAFFYVLSGAHGLHVLGGLAALTWTAVRAGRGAYTTARHSGLTHTAVYWHVVAGVWLHLLAVLSWL